MQLNTSQQEKKEECEKCEQCANCNNPALLFCHDCRSFICEKALQAHDSERERAHLFSLPFSPSVAATRYNFAFCFFPRFVCLLVWVENNGLSSFSFKRACKMVLEKNYMTEEHLNWLKVIWGLQIWLKVVRPFTKKVIQQLQAQLQKELAFSPIEQRFKTDGMEELLKDAFHQQTGLSISGDLKVTVRKDNKGISFLKVTGM